MAALLHHGVLQELAAAALFVRVAADRAPLEAKPAIEEALTVLIEQQASIRHFIDDLGIESDA